MDWPVAEHRQSSLTVFDVLVCSLEYVDEMEFVSVADSKYSPLTEPSSIPSIVPEPL
jgi:hypothetical protein